MRGGFKNAIQPGKLILALAAIIAIFVAGAILDGLTPQSSKVVVDINSQTNELEAYADGQIDSIDAYRRSVRQSNSQTLENLLIAGPLNLDRLAAEKLVAEGKALKEVEHKYKKQLDDALDDLGRNYELRGKDIRRNFEDILERLSGPEQAQEKKRQSQQLAGLKSDYLQLCDLLTTGKGDSLESMRCIDSVIQVSQDAQGEFRSRQEKDVRAAKELVMGTTQLAKTYQLAIGAEGRGIFETAWRFNSNQFHKIMGGLLWEKDTDSAKLGVHSILMSSCWLLRFHSVYAILFWFVKLAILALFGGAICRMAALQATRNERIGPLRALQFSMAKFGSFFTAPLIPAVIILLVGICIFAGGIVQFIPGIGKLIAGLMMGLALLGGFIMALVAIGLIGSFSLMFPTIAVEGSDSFDSISRSFSYIFARPWRMGFYSLLAAFYGMICYMFVRLFAFLTLAAVHTAAGAMFNMDGSSKIPLRGTLDAMWPSPTMGDLNPSINWLALSWPEAAGAAVIWIWVSLVVGLVMAFLLSFYFSVNTNIYLLLRRWVDATDLEDIYLERDVEELITEGSDSPDEAPPSAEGAGGEEDIQEDTPQADGDSAEPVDDQPDVEPEKTD